MVGRIHSFESFGTVDGPGIRFIVFLQGCPLRCKFCHNPDTWLFNGGTEYSTDTIVSKILKYKNYLSGGGVTVSGGEPLVQIDFLIELFEKLKMLNIHTCLDTSGILFDESNKPLKEKFDRLIKCTDLVLLDIKHIDNDSHINLTSLSNKNVLNFAKYLCENNVPTWIRYVLVPTINSDEKTLNQTMKFIKTLKNVQKIEVLPYHNMAIKKYEELKLEYPFKDIPLPTDKEITLAKKILKI